jgi:hypothetical protein
MNDLNSNYERILEVLRKTSKEQLLTYQRRKPKMSDLELNSLNLTAEFVIRRNYSKYFDGFKTRVFSKITSLTTIKYINKFIFNRNINNIKISII